MNKFISIASLFIIYAILIVSSNGKTTTMLQEKLKKRTSEQSMYIQKMISKKRFGASSAGRMTQGLEEIKVEKKIRTKKSNLNRKKKNRKKKKSQKRRPSRPRIGSDKLVIGGEDRKGNNKGNDEREYIEYDAKMVEEYLKVNLKCDPAGVKRIKRLLDTTPLSKDGARRVLLSGNCYNDGMGRRCDCMSARRYTGPFKSVNTDRMSICMEKDRYMQNSDKHGLGNPYHTGESNQNNDIPRHMKDQHVVPIFNIVARKTRLEWCFVKKITLNRSCKALQFCPRFRRRRLLNKGQCGS